MRLMRCHRCVVCVQLTPWADGSGSLHRGEGSELSVISDNSRDGRASGERVESRRILYSQDSVALAGASPPKLTCVSLTVTTALLSLTLRPESSEHLCVRCRAAATCTLRSDLQPAQNRPDTPDPQTRSAHASLYLLSVRTVKAERSSQDSRSVERSVGLRRR